MANTKQQKHNKNKTSNDKTKTSATVKKEQKSNTTSYNLRNFN